MAVPYPPPTAPSPRLGRAVKISERIASAIVDDIVANGLKEGDRLPNETAMTSQFGVGRGSLREALRILEVHGVISLRSGPGGGPVILATDPRDVARSFSLYLNLNRATIRELIQARLVIEPILARMAAETHESAGLERLREAVAYEASIPEGDPQFVFASNNFHYVLATLSGNKVIDLLATSLKDLYTTRVVARGLVNGLEHGPLRSEHRQIAEAIMDGKADRAERLARQHTEYYLGLVAAYPGFADSMITWG
jgi:GntR family transcriptional regulator, transcriptional repressor for pyruvate dehydrogenase complex